MEDDGEGDRRGGDIERLLLLFLLRLRLRLGERSLGSGTLSYCHQLHPIFPSQETLLGRPGLTWAISSYLLKSLYGLLNHEYNSCANCSAPLGYSSVSSNSPSNLTAGSDRISIALIKTSIWPVKTSTSTSDQTLNSLLKNWVARWIKAGSSEI
jgi:hypothetical protein